MRTKRTARKAVGPFRYRRMAPPTPSPPPSPPPPPSPSSSSSSSASSLPHSEVGSNAFTPVYSPIRRRTEQDITDCYEVQWVQQRPLTLNRREWLSDSMDDSDGYMDVDSESEEFLIADTASSRAPEMLISSPSYTPASPISSPSYTPASPLSSPSYTLASPSYSPASPTPSPARVSDDPSSPTGSEGGSYVPGSP